MLKLNLMENKMKIVISHKIKDFNHWIKFYDADEPRRAGAGIKTVGILKNVNDPGDLHIIMDVPNLDIIKGMIKSDDLKKVMQEAGVVSAPEVNVLEPLQ